MEGKRNFREYREKEIRKNKEKAKKERSRSLVIEGRCHKEEDKESGI